MVNNINEISKPQKISMSEIRIHIAYTDGGAGETRVTNLQDYETLVIKSRTTSYVVGTTYFQVLGYYTDEKGNNVFETILYTTDTNSNQEIYNISKYNAIGFNVICNVVGGNQWGLYRFNGIEIY